jgi:NAD(P)-dependent dehydrogenase (short-subunit alcohol dehydrogenase family)
MASILGQVSFDNSAAHVASKYGLIGLTKTTATEYASQGVRVNAVGPGFIRTPLIAVVEEIPEILKMLISLHLIGRLGELEELTEPIIWLCSDLTSFVTGSYYPEDGGYLAR